RPGITAAVIFVLIPILGEYLAPQIVGGTDGIMIGNLIDNFQKEALYARAASISLLIATFIVLLLILFRKSLSAKEADGAGGRVPVAAGAGDARRAQRLRRVRLRVPVRADRAARPVQLQR